MLGRSLVFAKAFGKLLGLYCRQVVAAQSDCMCGDMHVQYKQCITCWQRAPSVQLEPVPMCHTPTTGQHCTRLCMHCTVTVLCLAGCLVIAPGGLSGTPA
jgi:hypothetical protein